MQLAAVTAQLQVLGKQPVLDEAIQTLQGLSYPQLVSTVILLLFNY